MAWTTRSQPYSVGLAYVDAQHQQWIAILNRLHAAMREGNALEIQGKLLQELVAFSRAHFANEEFMLQRRNYPSLSAHRQLHIAFNRQVSDLQIQMNADSSLTLEVMDLLRGWLSNSCRLAAIGPAL